MELTKAKELLPYFRTSLSDRFSETYQSKIIDVVVGFEDFRLTQAMHPVGLHVDNFPRMPHDEGKYTLFAVLMNKQMVSIRKLVEADDIIGLIPNVESLDYMSYHPYDKEQDAHIHVYV